MEIYLQSFGSRLRIKDGLFEVVVPDLTGANYHVQAQFPAHEVKTILLQAGSSVSTDALLKASETGTDIIVLDKYGNPQSRLLPNRPTSTMLIWKNQLAISITPEAIRIAKGWIEDKLRERVAFLHKLRGYRDRDKVIIIDAAIASINEQLNRLHFTKTGTNMAETASSIRGHEGTASKIYLQTLSQLLPSEYQFSGRSKRPALDIFNTFLNYGYGILYRIIEKALLLAGVHPHIGFFHYDGYQNKSMVYDFIEPYRIWVEKAVFRLFSGKQTSMLQVDEMPEKGYRLKEEAKRMITDSIKMLLSDKQKEVRGKSFPLELFICEQAVDLATLLRNSSTAAL